MFLLKADKSYVKWCKITDKDYQTGSFEFEPGWTAKTTGKLKEENFLGYFMHHTGGSVKSSISPINSQIMEKLSQAIKYLPEQNDMSIKVLKQMIKKFPDKKHYLFSDTAFFNALPLKASTYAIPHKLREKGLKRYSGYGLCHEYAWKTAVSLSNKKTKKMISVYLGDNTNVAAIDNGSPVETSMGFSSIEGIPSMAGCGDIDPMIVFELHGRGFSFREINRMISLKSGLSAILGKNISFLELMKTKTDESKAKEILCYSIVKYIGAFVSVMGGVDTIVFISEDMNVSMRFILDICSGLNFLGLKCKSELKGFGDPLELSIESSRIRSYCLWYNEWKIMYNIGNKNILEEK